MTPRYTSTRGGSSGVSFKRALLAGLAADGGLYVPDYIPKSNRALWTQARPFSDLAYGVLHPFLKRELSDSALRAITDDAFSFPVPMVSLDGGAWEGTHVLELFHGPTLSFKDFGARAMARLMGHFVQDDRWTILVATSGDTGSAVADGFAGQDLLRVAVLFPRGQVSPTQELQLTVERPGVRAYAVDGTFDDCQRMVKAALTVGASAGLRLSAANSINVGRLLPQMAYYFWAFLTGGFEAATVCVPSGNLGNITAGVFAALSGLPIRHFLAAHNANDGFPRFLAGGPDSFGPSVRTLSNAMDVGAPSNFERLRTVLSDEDMRRIILGASVSDDSTIMSMRSVYEEAGYVADPHTAVALTAARMYREASKDDGPVVVLAGAHPAKFPETMRRALGITPIASPPLASLVDLPRNVRPISAVTDDLVAELLAWE